MEQDNSYQNLVTEVNHITVSYNEAGEGIVPVIFIHGYPFDKSMWNGQLESLKSSTRAIAYDIRGFGASGGEKTYLSIELFAEDLIAFMDKLDIEKAIICGLSMGGYIALNAMSRFPERFRALILCDTQCIADTTLVKENRYTTIDQIQTDGADAFKEKFIKSIFHPESLINKQELVENIRNIVFANSTEIIVAGLIALAERSETCTALQNIKIPTLIICGREDKVTPLAQSELMHRDIESSSLKIIDNAGHVSNLEQPDEFNKYLHDFLKTLNSAVFSEDPFQIDLDGVMLTIQSLDTVDFAVFKDDKRLAIITPVRHGDSLMWRSKEISAEDAQQIGDLVAVHESL